MIQLKPFEQAQFNTLISWINNEELLLTIAGTYFNFPLTTDQLQQYVNDETSDSFSVVDAFTNTVIGHAEIVKSGNQLYKIDKLLIGDQSNRGKGIGKQVMRELLKYAFEKLDAATVELNVFDWNTAGIRCYEGVGFVLNPDKKQTFEVNGKTWQALNMRIEKDRWSELA